MAEIEKPPIGIRPARLVLPLRIGDLAEAIIRYGDHPRLGKDKEVTKTIRAWCAEIIGHCDTIDRLQEEHDGE